MGAPYWEKRMAFLLLSFSAKQRLLYALTKNPTHESTGAGVQGASGEYSIIPAAVLNGNARYCDFVQDGRFQLPRPARLRGTHGHALG